MTTTRVFKSTDASAPTLNGTAGSLIAVLDSCLVNGYGAKAAVGWAKSFAGTNKAVYRAPLGNRFYLRVLDDGSDGTNGARVANIRGYEAMTDVDTGTGDFPTAAQMGAGLFVGKSSTADSVARPWIVLADEKRVIVLSAYYSTLSEAFAHFCFGDLIGGAAGDAYGCFVFGASTSANAMNSAVGASTGRGNLLYTASSLGLYAARAVSGAGGSAQQWAAFYSSYTAGSGNGSFPAPNAPGEIYADAVQICDGGGNTAAPRGYFPGLLYCRNSLDYGTNPTGTAYGQYQVVRYGGSHASCYLIDIGDWE